MASVTFTWKSVRRVLLTFLALLAVADGIFQKTKSRSGKLCEDCDLLKNELRLAHQELIKAKILKRLGLPGVPIFSKAHKVEALPDPILNSWSSSPDTSSSYLEEEIFLLPDAEQNKRKNRTYLHFKFPTKYLFEPLASARIWIKNKRSSLTVAFRPFEQGQESQLHIRKTVPVAKRRREWNMYDINEKLRSVKKKIRNPLVMKHLKISVLIHYTETETINRSQVPNEETPVIKLTFRRVRHRRQKRNNYCPSKSRKCCLRPFVINFRDIGWDEFIVRPIEIEANVCSGKCDKTTPLSKSGFLKRQKSYLFSAEVQDRLQLCCTGRAHSPVKILYFDQDDGGPILNLQEIKDLIVTDCWCI